MEQAFTTLVGRLVAERPERSGLEHVEYLDQETGFLCRIVQDEEGRYFGYVSVPREHPFYALPLNGCPVDCREAGSGPCEHSPVGRLEVAGELLQAGADGPGWWFGFTLPEGAEQAAAEVAVVARQLARIGGAARNHRSLPGGEEGQEHPTLALIRGFQTLSAAHHSLLTALVSPPEDGLPGVVEIIADHVARRIGTYWEALEAFLPQETP